jgi:hypothetical protein
MRADRHLGAYRLHRRRAEGSLFVAELVRTWHHLVVRPAELGEDPAGEIIGRLGALLGAADGFAPVASELAALSFAGAEDSVPPALADRLRAAVQRRLARMRPGAVPAADQLRTCGVRPRAATRLLALRCADCPERNVGSPSPSQTRGAPPARRAAAAERSPDRAAAAAEVSRGCSSRSEAAAGLVSTFGRGTRWTGVSTVWRDFTALPRRRYSCVALARIGRRGRRPPDFAAIRDG